MTPKFWSPAQIAASVNVIQNITWQNMMYTELLMNVDRVYIKEKTDPVYPLTSSGDIFITISEGKSYVNAYKTLDQTIHRLNGPAIIFQNGDTNWYIDGVEVTEKVLPWLKEHKIRHWTKWTKHDITLFKMKFCG